MNSREEGETCDLFLDELEYLLGPVIGLYKTTKNTRKYIISGLNSIDEELKGITFASFNNNLNFETCIKYIDHWINYIKRMKIEIERFQNLSDFEQNALKIRINFINNKYKQLRLKKKFDFFDNYYFPKSPTNKNNKNNKNTQAKQLQLQRRHMNNERNYKSIWMDRLLIDYFSRNLYFKTAYALIEDDTGDNCNNSLNILSNIRLYHKIREVLNAIKTRNYHIIIKWCRANKTLLKDKKIKSNLEFMAKCRFVVELLRNGNIENGIKYITNQMSKDLECGGSYRWNQINELFICSMYVPIVFNTKNNPKYGKLLKNKNNKLLYKKYKKEYKNDLKKKIPKNVYKIFFKAAYFWKKIEIEFWRIFKLIYGLNKYSMFEYVLSSSLQTLLTPYCYHKEWKHLNCITCLNGRNKLSQLTHKSHLRGIEFPHSFIVCDRIHSITNSNLINNTYKIIKDFMINYQESITINSNVNALITPNGSIIHKDSAKILVDTNKFIQKDFEKIFLYYHLF